MLTFEIQLPGFPRPLRVLIDSGASENYARRASLELNKLLLDDALSKSDPTDTVHVKLADGTIAVSPRVVATLPMNVEDIIVSDEDFFVIDLDGRWDLILGMGWLEKHHPWINWRSKKIYKTL